MILASVYILLNQDDSELIRWPICILINLDIMLEKRGMKSNELADIVGITTANISILKTGKARAIRFSTL